MRCIFVFCIMVVKVKAQNVKLVCLSSIFNLYYQVVVGNNSYWNTFNCFQYNDKYIATMNNYYRLIFCSV